ncbi:MAG: hypothetical protein IPH57_02905 [Saprospiraceae bacterium]|nr:hypothetical protein [Saprospiraceae bacterium]
MSIPKEPRQLMINVMYIVLTALLALNVSAEVFNAFDMVNDGLSKSSIALDEQNTKLPATIKERAQAKPIYAHYAIKVDSISKYGKEFSDYIDQITTYLVDQTGDKNGVVDDKDYELIGSIKKPKGERNFDVTTKFLVDKGKGMELHDKVLEYRNKFLNLVEKENRATFASKIALTIDDESWKSSKTKRRNWADFNFNHMPVGAVLPIFAKYKNDVKATEAAVYQHYLGKLGGEEVILDQFTVASAPKKSYIIKGDKYETEIFLSAFASSASNTGVSISINGARVPVDKDGIAKYTTTATSTGVKKYNATVTVTNPVTKEVKSYKKEFEYEVGERSVAIAATKMNVFYVGVDNPVEVSAAAISSIQMKVSMSGAGGGNITRNGDGTYTVNVSNPTRKDEFAYIDVNAPGIPPTKKAFRVKRIPSPQAMLGGKMGGVITSGEFKLNQAIIPVLESFDFDAKCLIEGFRLVRAPKREDPKVAENRGGRYGSEAQALVNVAKPGDRYYYESVKCKCPGDKITREINPLTFVIQ